MLRNIGAQWFRQVIFIIVGLVLPPLMNAHLGTTNYGAWKTLMATAGFLKLLSLGVPMATVRAIANQAALKDRDGLNRVVGTSLGIFLGIGLLALVVGAGLYAFFELTYLRSGKMPAAELPALRFAFAIIAFQVAISFSTQLPYSILAGHHDFVRQNSLMVGVFLARFVLIMTVLFTGGSLVFLALVELTATILEFLFPWRVIKRRYPGIVIDRRHFDRGQMRSIFVFGSYILLLHAGMKLAFQTDALVIGRWINLDAVAHYDSANTFLVYLIELMIGVGGVIMPMATRLQTEKRLDQLESVFFRWSKITFSLGLMVGLYLLVLGPEFVALWMHDDAFLAPAAEVTPALMLSGFVFLPIRAVALPMLLGLGKAKVPAVLFLVNGLVNLGISIALVRSHGLFGVALGTAIPNVAYAVIVLIYACRSIESSPLRWLAYVAPRCILGALPVAALLYWWRDHFNPRSFIELAVPGLLSVALFALIWIFFVYRGDAEVDFLAKIRGRLSRRSA